MGVQKTQVRAWHNVPLPGERLRFWSAPSVEIELAKEAGASVFRLGVDWGRIVPQEPVDGIQAVVCMAMTSILCSLQRRFILLRVSVLR